MKTYIAVVTTLILLTAVSQFKENNIQAISSKAGIASIEGMTVISDFEKEPTQELNKGLYKSLGGTGSNGFGLTLYIGSNTITKTLIFKDRDVQMKGTANYTYDGSVIKYTNLEGDKMLFIAQGEPFMKLSDVKFAVIGECSPDAEKALAGEKGLDVMCKNGVEITEFNKFEVKRVVKPMSTPPAATDTTTEAATDEELVSNEKEAIKPTSESD